MNRMVKPEMNVVRFNENDVIVASGYVPGSTTMKLYNFGDGISGNGTVDYNGSEYIFKNPNYGNLLNQAIKISVSGKANSYKLYNSDKSELIGIYSLSIKESYKSGYSDNIDGIYEYDSALAGFVFRSK